MERSGKGLGGFASGAAEIVAQREPVQQGSDVGRLDNLKMFVGSIALQADDGLGGVENSDATGLAERDYIGMLEAVVGRAEVLLVAEKDLTDDAPHVVLGIGIEERHAPAFLRRREAAEHEQPGFRRKEGLQGVVLDVGSGHGEEIWEQRYDF